MSDTPSILRLRFETVGSIMAIVVGVAALWVSWDQGRVMRQEMRASVWPALQVQGFVDTAGGDLAIGLSVENAGIGPALIERITLYDGDDLVVDLEDLRARVDEAADLSFDTVTGRVMGAGTRFRPFIFRFDDPEALLGTDGPVTPVMASALIGSWRAEICYCSSLGDCWTADISTNPPADVDQCDAEPASAL